MSKHKVVIVPVHNQGEYLKKCINSFIDYTFVNRYELIVVNDGSTDKDTNIFINYLESLSPFITVLKNQTAQGFSAACNKGIQYALDNFDFNCLCLLNSDAEVVTENWFDKVEEKFVTGNKIGVASVMSNNAMAQTVKNIDKYLNEIEQKPTVYCNFVHGFCYFISKELIETIGLFDETTFPHYGSEDDYSLKSIKSGFKNIIVGSVFVKHNNETSYTHAVRAKFVKTTLPALQRRWGYKYVADCVNQANKAGQYLNNI